MEITSINKPVLAQKEESSDNSLCKRASVAAKPITTLLEPFQLDDLHTHISTVLSFRPGINWIIPEDGFTLPSNPPERPFKCDADVSQAYLRAYLDYFVNVRNCNDINNSDMKYEQVFRIGGTTSGTILKHILSFSWTLLDLGTTDEMENLSAGVTVFST